MKHKSKEFLCEECDFKATSRRDVLKHYKSNHSKKPQYKCDMCDFIAVGKDQLRPHIKNTHGGRKYKCETCGFSALSQRTITKHQYMLKCLPFMVQGVMKLNQ